MDENMLKKLNRAFTMNRWSLECFLGAVIMMFTWTQLENVYDRNALPLKIMATAVFAAGIGFFITGRKIVKEQASLLKNRKKRSAEEEWFLQEMTGYEDRDGHERLLKKIEMSSHNERAEAIEKAAHNPGLLGKYFSIGRVYAAGNNLLLDRLPIIVSLVIAFVYIMIVK